MPKDIKTKKPNKKEVEVKKIDQVPDIGEHVAEEEIADELLPEDVQEALGMNKAEKASKVKEIDYISELENGLDDFDFDEKTPKPSFDDEFGSDMD